MDCVSLLGSQLAPEDLMGVPQIHEGKTRFHPPAMIACEEPYVLFCDELNGATHDIQKAFYSLIHEHRIGEYRLPAGSVVIGAGNRSQDSAIVRPMSSALINRMIHVSLRADYRSWMQWAKQRSIHPLVLSYLQTHPDHLVSPPPKSEEPFSSPRAWHMLSDALRAYSARGDELNPDIVKSSRTGRSRMRMRPRSPRSRRSTIIASS
jgi:MoxR-like ATPase